MNVVIPPLFFYVVGAILVLAGAGRTLTLGRRRPSRDIQQLEEGSAAADKAAQARKRHFIFGIVWVLLGLFLILSTAGVLRSRMPG